MATIRELVTKIGFDVDNKALNRLDKNINTIKSNILAVGKVGVAAGATIFGLAKQAGVAAEEISRASDRTGLSIENFQRYQAVARKVGTETEDVASTFREFNVRIGEAVKGEGQAVEGFQNLGIELRNSQGEIKATSRLFNETTTALNGVESQARRTALRDQIFGGESEKLDPLLNLTTDQVNNIANEAERMGRVLSEVEVENLTELNRNFRDIFNQVRGLVNQALADLAPEMNKVIDRTEEWIASNKEVIKQNLQGFIQGLYKAVNALWTIIEGVIFVFKSFADIVGGVSNAIKILTGAFLAFKALQIGQALIGIVLTMRKLRVATLLTSAAGWLLSAPFWGVIIVLGLVVAAFYYLYNNADYVMELIKNGWDGLVKYIANLDDWLEQKLNAFWNWLGKKAKDTFKYLSSWVKWFGNFFVAGFEKLKGSWVFIKEGGKDAFEYLGSWVNWFVDLFSLGIDKISGWLSGIVDGAKKAAGWLGLAGDQEQNANNGARELTENPAASIDEMARRSARQHEMASNNKNVSVRSNIEVAVPPGTSEQQQEFLRESARQAFREEYEGELEKALFENPQSE